jgi:hypothetical protein
MEVVVVPAIRFRKDFEMEQDALRLLGPLIGEGHMEVVVPAIRIRKKIELEQDVLRLLGLLIGEGHK